MPPSKIFGKKNMNWKEISNRVTRLSSPTDPFFHRAFGVENEPEIDCSSPKLDQEESKFQNSVMSLLVACKDHELDSKTMERFKMNEKKRMQKLIKEKLFETGRRSVLLKNEFRRTIVMVSRLSKVASGKIKKKIVRRKNKSLDENQFKGIYPRDEEPEEEWESLQDLQNEAGSPVHLRRKSDLRDGVCAKEQKLNFLLDESFEKCLCEKRKEAQYIRNLKKLETANSFGNVADDLRGSLVSDQSFERHSPGQRHFHDLRSRINPLKLRSIVKINTMLVSLDRRSKMKKYTFTQPVPKKKSPCSTQKTLNSSNDSVPEGLNMPPTARRNQRPSSKNREFLSPPSIHRTLDAKWHEDYGLDALINNPRSLKSRENLFKATIGTKKQKEVPDLMPRNSSLPGIFGKMPLSNLAEGSRQISRGKIKEWAKTFHTQFTDLSQKEQKIPSSQSKRSMYLEKPTQSPKFRLHHASKSPLRKQKISKATFKKTSPDKDAPNLRNDKTKYKNIKIKS